MVTEKYLLRTEAEWTARQEARGILDRIVELLGTGDVAEIGRATERNFNGPIQTIIPWASNLYTETLIRRVRDEFGAAFWGFWMLGGMSGGGMGFIFAPERKAEAQQRLQAIMGETKQRLEGGVPFAMEPVVYDSPSTNAARGPICGLGSARGCRRLLQPLSAGRAAEGDAVPAMFERGDLRQFSALCRSGGDDTAAHYVLL